MTDLNIGSALLAYVRQQVEPLEQRIAALEEQLAAAAAEAEVKPKGLFGRWAR